MKRVLYIFIFLVVVAAVFMVFRKTSFSEAYVLGGTLDKVGEDSIVVSVAVFKEENGAMVEQENTQGLTVLVAQDVVIKRTILLVPASVSFFEVDKLESEESMVNLGVMREDFNQFSVPIGIEVKAQKRIGDRDFHATEINYRFPRFGVE